jgi:hypothetical protein
MWLRPPLAGLVRISRSPLGPACDPDQSSPAFDVVVVCREIPRQIAAQMQSAHYRLRPQIFAGRISNYFGQSEAREGVVQCHPRGFGGIPVTPSAPNQTPANVEMRTEWVARPRWHNSSVAEKSTFMTLDGPTAKSMLTIYRHVAIQLCVAFAPADWTAVILHHLRVRVHSSECVSVTLLPTAKPSARRFDLHAVSYTRPCERQSQEFRIKSKILERPGLFAP